MKAPALCNNCGVIFPSNLFEFDNCTNVTLSNCDGGTCPKCGGKSRILDGVYNFVNNAVELLKGPERTVSELQKLAAILQTAKKDKASFEEVTEKINNELPAFSTFKDFLPKTRSELYAFISVIIAIITLFISQARSGAKQQIEINQVFNNVYQSQVVNEERQTSTNIPKVISPKRIKVGRNERCPCGSGLKYKKCCLRK